jgi:2-aminoethylphosphonate-pyruvate transaminase
MTILLNPGPVSLSAHVRQALLLPDLCHREPEFSELQTRIRRQLLQLYDLSENDWNPVLLTGSGTAAVEAMLASLVPEEGRVLILANGVYGERMAKIAEVYGIEHSVAQQPWGSALDIDTIRAQLEQGTRYTHIAVVHHETTTGRLNHLDELAALADHYQSELLIDGVSSFGAETLNFNDWPVAACAATANKCLHGVPGISFVITRRPALANGMTRSLYLDLNAYAREQDNGGTPFTQSVQCCYALDAALAECLEAGGWQARQTLYRQRMQIVRDGLVKAGIEPLLEDGASSCVLNAFRLPADVDYMALHDRLKTAGFVIYAGQGQLAQSIFRIAVMGEMETADLQRLVGEVRDIVQRDA